MVWEKRGVASHGIPGTRFQHFPALGCDGSRSVDAGGATAQVPLQDRLRGNREDILPRGLGRKTTMHDVLPDQVRRLGNVYVW